MLEERLSEEEYGFGFDGRKISSLDSRLNESTSLWWIKPAYHGLDPPQAKFGHSLRMVHVRSTSVVSS